MHPWVYYDPYERYIKFSFLVLLCSFVQYIIILFNLGFSGFCTGQFVKQSSITEICNLFKYLKMQNEKNDESAD